MHVLFSVCFSLVAGKAFGYVCAALSGLALFDNMLLTLLLKLFYGG